jgi:hypothetical protein
MYLFPCSLFTDDFIAQIVMNNELKRICKEVFVA